MSFHIAPSGTTKACTQLLFHTCSDTPKACKQTLMFKPCWNYKPLNSSNICSSILVLHPACSAACTWDRFLFFLCMFAHVGGGGGLICLLSVTAAVSLRECDERIFFLYTLNRDTNKCVWKSQWVSVFLETKKTCRDSMIFSPIVLNEWIGLIKQLQVWTCP